MLKKYPLLSVILAMSILLAVTAGCQSPSAQPQTNEPVKVTLMLDWTPNTNHTGLFVAQENGYFKEQGLDVSIVNPSSQGTLEQLVATGKVDFGVSQQEQVTTARVNDLPIVSLAAILQHNTSGFASLKSKNIRTAKDFENKVYGGWGLPSETAVLTALMQKENADFKKLKIVNIGEADQLASLSKDIDLTWIFYGWTGIQAELRNQQLNMLWLKDIDPALDYYTPVFITNEKMIKENPDTVRKVMAAVSKGYEFAIQNPAQAAELLVKNAPEADPEMIRKSQAWLSPQYQADAPRWGEQKESVWKAYAQWLFDNKLLDKMIDPAKAYTNDFLPGK
jgi:ABC-type nitrate/sulfonate/bicarbonate transport system substrate-binding protein